MTYVDSTDRNAVDFTLFGIGFIGKLLAAAGIIVGSAGIALFGLFLVLVVLAGLAARRSPADGA